MKKTAFSARAEGLPGNNVDQNPNPSGFKMVDKGHPNLSPVFRVEGELERKGEGMYDKMNSIGANEIIIESPSHSVKPEDIGLDQMARVLTTYRDRMADLEKDPRLRYTLIYKNSGTSAGALYSHPMSLLASTPVIPKRVKEELDGAKQYFAYKERCIFCDLVREELRFGSRVIIETRSFVAFCPYASKFPFESWIMPKRHGCAFQDIRADEIEDMALILSSVLKKLRHIFDSVSFNYFIHSAEQDTERTIGTLGGLSLAFGDNAEAFKDKRV
jgi:UDPglucose--hexose-1-phosphate uridylyltransferase